MLRLTPGGDPDNPVDWQDTGWQPVDAWRPPVPALTDADIDSACWERLAADGYRLPWDYYREVKGLIPPGAALHHTCGNPGCRNPAHLLIVSPGEQGR
jgi:hypothetical protein